MKNKIIIILTFMAMGFSTFAHKKDPDYLNARRNGGKAQIILSISDDLGNAISNASIRVLMGMNFREQAYYIEGLSNAKGEFVVEGKTTGNEIEIEVTKSGYYKTFKKLCFIKMGNEYDVEDGKWQPWGMQLPLRLRAIHNPIKMIGDTNGYYIPATNKWIGFDMKRSDWVFSSHKGVRADFEILFEWDGKPTRDSQLLNLHFRNTETHGGFYYSDLIKESAFRGAYSASPEKISQKNATCNEVQKNVRGARGAFPRTKQLILRSRCICDENGALKSAHYSAIQWIAVDGLRNGKGEMLLSYQFNPTPNDTNLECNMKNNLCPTQDQIHNP